MSKRTLLILSFLAVVAVGRADAGEGVWTTRAPMPEERFQPAVAGGSGRLYVAGGIHHLYDGKPTRTLFSYDPAANLWATKAPMPAPSSNAAAAFVDGILYVIGGHANGNTLGTVFAYDPETDTWSTRAPMPTARAFFAVCVVNSIIYAVGGTDPFGGYPVYSTLEAYDPKANTWTTKASMPTARFDLVAAAVDGLLYAVAGNDGLPGAAWNEVEVYDPTTGRWTVNSPMSARRIGPYSGAAVGGRIYVTNPNGDGYGQIDAYDPVLDMWARAPSILPRSLPVVAALEGTLYAVGGRGGVDTVNVVEAFRPCVPPPAGLVGWWPGDGDALDYAGESDGALGPGVTFEAGIVDQAFRVQPYGPTGAVDCGNRPALHVSSGDFSVEGWVFVAPPGDCTWCDVHVVTKMRPVLGAPNADGWRLFLVNGGEAGFGLAMCFGGGPGVNACGGIRGGHVPWGSWTHVAATKHANPAGGFAVDLYVNGVKTGSGTVASFYDSHSTNLLIGGEYVNARYDEVALYDRALSESEIRSHFEAGSAGMCKAARLIVPSAVVQACDGTGGTATVNFLVRIRGGTPPAGSTVTVTDVTGGVVLLPTQPAALGDIGVGPNTFPMGASTVEAVLADASGAAIARRTFTVQVEDTVAPVLSGCVDRTIECTGPQTTVTPELLGVSATDACDPNPTVSLAPSALPLGPTTVTATARDASGNTSACEFVVTVRDTAPPAFVAPPADVVAECTGGAGATVPLDALATDASGVVTLAWREGSTVLDPMGATFAVGEHRVTCTATDSSGNATSVSFFVTVEDNDAPVLLCPADITTTTDPGECYALVPFEVTVTDECDPDATVTCTAPWGPVTSPFPFPVGLTEVSCTATDHAGNSVNGSFRVLVQDKEPPTIDAPASVTLVTDCAGRPLTITPPGLGVSALDNCDIAPAIVVSPSTLNPGTTEVTCTATDDDGNASTATIAVTVLRGPFEWQFLRPLDGNVDNLVRPGQTVPLKLKVTCDNVFEPGATAAIESVVCVDSEGTPIANETVDDSGLANDGGSVLRLEDGYYVHNLSTKEWSSASGLRFRVVVNVTMPGHADTRCEVMLKNK